MHHKCFQVFILFNVSVWLCASLPISYEQRKQTADLLNKLFAGERRSMQDEWSRDERSMYQPTGERNNGEPDLSMREMLLRDILEWNRRKLEQPEQSQNTLEKRQPCRISPGHPPPANCYQASQDTPEKQEQRKRYEWALKEPGQAQMTTLDMEEIKEYDMELEKALNGLEIKGRGSLYNQM